MTQEIETQTIKEINDEIRDRTRDEINEAKRQSKYSSDEDRHEAIKHQKVMWYRRNRDKQKLKSLKSYYQKQLQKQDLKEEIKLRYEKKLNEINIKLDLI